MLHDGYDSVMTTLSSIEMSVWSYLGNDLVGTFLRIYCCNYLSCSQRGFWTTIDDDVIIMATMPGRSRRLEVRTS